VCGIAAVLDPGGGIPADAGRSMIRALRHRGPDGEAMRRRGPVLLVHTRLAIVDVEGGAQPLSSEDGSCTVVVNGEIYNQLDLRRELERRGHRFATRSDSEVVVHAYEEFGLDCLRRLNGIFALALWDERRRRLLLARDPLGVKPLYWWTDGTRLVAASEVRALIAAGFVSPELDLVALQHFLTWRFVPAPRTLFRGVSKLAPASYLLAQGSAPQIGSYRSAPGPPIDDASTDEIACELRRQIVAAVGRQTMSDVPYGTFLSGGLDSAAIVASLRQRAEGRLRTFTIGFPEYGGSLDERAAAAETARAFGTDHHSTAMLGGDFGRELAEGVGTLEEPCGSPSAPALLQLSRFTSRSVKVVLSGQGADEPLGGYYRASAAAALRLLPRLPRRAAQPLRSVIEALPRNERAKRAVRVIEQPAGLDRLLGVFEIAAADQRRRLVTGAVAGVEAEAADERRRLAAGVLADVAGGDLLDQALYLDTHLVLPDHLLLYGDKMSMAAGLELRVPFLDLELMRFVERVPGRLRVRWGMRKWLYRRAMGELVPPFVLEREKHGFTTHYDRWLRASLGDEVLRSYAAGGELSYVIDRSAVDALVSEHRRGRADHKRLLYCLLEFAHWHRAFLDARAPRPAVQVA
jgi:asparagine synthase (glutamine-hydrolysing)